MRLTSWKRKGLAWGAPTELTGLQNCVKNMITKNTKLVNVVQVMLFCRILLCQRRAFNLWEFDPAEHQMLQEIFGTTHKDVWRVLFKGAVVPPSLTEDRGLSAKRHANPVSFCISQGIYLPQLNDVRDLSSHAINRTG